MSHTSYTDSETTPPTQWPKISIITPSYNQGRFLEACIRSVLDQQYPNLEYIIIDGGSTDESVEIIQRYEQHLTYWVSERDNGQSDAINKGFRMASGQIVAWMNSDDFYLPGAFEAVARSYLRYPYASFFMGDGLRVDEEGRAKCDFYPDDAVYFNRAAMIYGVNYVIQPATFIGRACLERAGHLDVNLRYGMDTDLWIRLSEVAPPVRVEATLAASREYGETKTSTGSFKRVEELRHIAERHSGAPITPGTICYFLDTLHQLAQERTDMFPPAYRQQIETFWAATAHLLINYGAHPHGGFPVHPAVLFGQISQLQERIQLVETDREARLQVITQLQQHNQQIEADREARLQIITQLQQHNQQLNQHNEQLQQYLAQAEADREVLTQLRHHLELVEADREARLELIQQLSAQLAAAEADRNAQREQREYLNSQLTAIANQMVELEADRAARLDLIATLNEQISTLQLQLTGSEADREARLEAIQYLQHQLEHASNGYQSPLIRRATRKMLRQLGIG